LAFAALQTCCRTAGFGNAGKSSGVDAYRPLQILNKTKCENLVRLSRTQRTETSAVDGLHRVASAFVAPVDSDMLRKHQLVSGGTVKTKTSRRATIMLPLVSLVAVFALSAQAEPNGPPPKGGAKPAAHAAPAGAHPGAGPAPVHQGAVHQGAMHQGAVHQGAAPGRGPQNAHMARGNFQARHFGGHGYHGRVAWEGGRWRHEIHNGRDGWWWDVGGAWYFYPQEMDGPPAYVSDVEAIDDAADGPPVADGYPPPPGAYAPPPPDPAASAVGGAIVGGLLGGLLTGRPGGAIAGAAAGGVTGAIVGAQAASRPGYYLAQGNCYYRYPSGQYVQADPRACY
jgi:hypothetical protein